MPAKAGSANLKPLLEKVLQDFPPAKRVNDDPVQFPRWFFERGRSLAETETVALISAMLAYGSAPQFIKKLKLIMQVCSYNYLETITSPSLKHLEWPAYRLSTADEIETLALASGDLVKEYGCLKAVFLRGYLPEKSLRNGLKSLRELLADACQKRAGNISRGLRHLLPDPASGGCVKRWHMFLRWMVRPDDGVDMHLWPEVNPALLLIPLDRHISRIARNLGLTSRKADDWKTAEEISQKLREFDPDDPIKFDFSLCHLGIAGKCTHGKDLELCRRCLLNQACMAFSNKA